MDYRQKKLEKSLKKYQKACIKNFGSELEDITLYDLEDLLAMAWTDGFVSGDQAVKDPAYAKLHGDYNSALEAVLHYTSIHYNTFSFLNPKWRHNKASREHMDFINRQMFLMAEELDGFREREENE